MQLTGRFRFRKSLFGRFVLQVEYETGGIWPIHRGGTRPQRWRDARVVDVLQREVRGLFDHKAFVDEIPQANHGPLVTAASRRWAAEAQTRIAAEAADGAGDGAASPSVQDAA